MSFSTFSSLPEKQNSSILKLPDQEKEAPQAVQNLWETKLFVDCAILLGTNWFHEKFCLLSPNSIKRFPYFKVGNVKKGKLLQKGLDLLLGLGLRLGLDK